MAIPYTHNGGPVGNANITEASTVVQAYDNTRAYFFIRNQSIVNTVWIALGVTAEVDKGLEILPLEFLEMTWDNLTPAAINAICDTGLTAVVSYQVGT